MSTNDTKPDVVEVVRHYQRQGVWGEPLQRKLARHAKTVSGLDREFAARLIAISGVSLSSRRGSWKVRK